MQKSSNPVHILPRKQNFSEAEAHKIQMAVPSGENFIYCDTCIKSNKCIKSQHSVTRQVLSKDHQSCFNIPALQKYLERCQVKLNNQQDKEELVLLKDTHWMAHEGFPLSELFHSFLTGIVVADLVPLQQKAVAYSSRYTAGELLSSTVDTVHTAPKIKLNESPIVIAFIDQSTDLTNHKCCPNYRFRAISIKHLFCCKMHPRCDVRIGNLIDQNDEHVIG